MLRAAGIKFGTAHGAPVAARQVLSHGQFRIAMTAKYRLFSPFALRPNFDRMASQRFVAIFASIVPAAALHLDRDDVDGCAVVGAPSLWVYFDTNYGGPAQSQPPDCPSSSKRGGVACSVVSPRI
jgi:hypothetical protein